MGEEHRRHITEKNENVAKGKFGDGLKSGVLVFTRDQEKQEKSANAYSTLRSAALKKALQNVVLLKLHIKGRESVRQKYEKI